MAEKLHIQKRLPYIKLPKEKVDLFIEWYNNDLRNLEEVPEVFKEGYIEIDTSDLISVKIPSIFDIKSEEKYNNLKLLYSKVLETYSKSTLYFNIINTNTMLLKGWYGNKEFAFDVEYNLKEDKLMKLMKDQILGENRPHLPSVQNKLRLDLMSSEFDELKKRQDEFNQKYGDVCFCLTLSVIWYLATNKAEKYIVDENTQIIETEHTNFNKKHKKHKHNRNITTPIYNLVDKRTTTVERLIKKRNGWTISHSFQVRGHYRHYKNGKTIFIKSYEKGKGLDDFQNTIITISPQD